ncbi:hypothetical protein Vafri_13641, partial [Volvox africanus]
HLKTLHCCRCRFPCIFCEVTGESAERRSALAPPACGVSVLPSVCLRSSAMQTRRIGGLRYFTKGELEATNPSRRDGIDAITEAKWRSTTSKIVKLTIKTLKLPDWVYETAMCYIIRFFLTRSISKNDRHLVIGGAILLASKAQESPRPVQDVAYVLLQLKYSTTQKSQTGGHQITLEQFIDGIKMAEQAILFSMNFHLNVETNVSLARGLLEPLDMWAKANPLAEEAEDNKLKLSLYGAMMFFLNDSAMTTLSVQYPNSKIAPVALLMAAKRIAETRYACKDVPAILQRVLALGDDPVWLNAKGLSLEIVTDISEQINELYNSTPPQAAAQAQQQRQPHVPAFQNSTPTAAASGKDSDAAHQNPASSALAAATTSTPLCWGRGRPCSSAAPGTIAGAAAGDTPELPHTRSPPCKLESHPHQLLHAGKRVSDGDECTGDEQHATSELHAAPEQRQEAEEDPCACARNAVGSGPCRTCTGLEDSANENCSPDGLTTGNASGSGCGAVEGQPEVCSRTETRLQQLQSQPTQLPPSLEISNPLQSQPSQHGKEDNFVAECSCSDPDDVDLTAPPCKVRRLEESQPVSDAQISQPQSQPTQAQSTPAIPSHPSQCSKRAREEDVATDFLASARVMSGIFASAAKARRLEESQAVPVWQGS